MECCWKDNRKTPHASETVNLTRNVPMDYTKQDCRAHLANFLRPTFLEEQEVLFEVHLSLTHYLPTPLSRSRTPSLPHSLPFLHVLRKHRLSRSPWKCIS